MTKRLILLLVFYSFFIQKTLCQEKEMGKYNLMPWPQKIKSNSAKFLIDSSVTISINSEDEGRVRNVAVNFLRRLANRTGVFIDKGFPLSNKTASIEIEFKTVGELNVNTDESYYLNVGTDKVTILANTDIGAIRALETLLQLTNYNENEYYFEGVSIEDSPRFVWRGLMIDVARHFQPVDVIKRNLDAMASVKLNVFHWHLTDDQGFRIESKKHPKLQKLASDGLYYTKEQIKDVVAYAS
ncbi:MAG: family 20 glycosylhydrolase, partial [Winogradskyella sp.]|uniref:family 20 glycosylhydrolase n=1 Tax=Winogradskyella sp. TaxID=1883156 RepID=UPI0025E3C9F9